MCLVSQHGCDILASASWIFATCFATPSWSPDVCFLPLLWTCRTLGRAPFMLRKAFSDFNRVFYHRQMVPMWFPWHLHWTDHANQKTFPSPGLANFWACHPTTSPAAFRRLVSLELGANFYLLLSFLYCDRSGLRRSRLRLSKATSLGAFWESLRTWPFACNSVAHRWNGAICHFTCQLSDVGTTKIQHDPRRRAGPFGPLGSFGPFGPFEPAVWLSHHAGLELSAPASLGAFVHTGTGFNKSHTNQWNLVIYQRVMHIIRILFFIFIYIHIILYLYAYCGNKSSDTKPRHCAPECQSVQLEGQPWAHLARRVTGSRRQLGGVTSPWHVSYCIYHLSIKFIQFGISQITVLDSFGVWSWRVVGMVSFGYFSLSMFDPFWPLLHLVWMLGSSGTSWPASVMSTPSV